MGRNIRREGGMGYRGRKVGKGDIRRERGDIRRKRGEGYKKRKREGI